MARQLTKKQKRVQLARDVLPHRRGARAQEGGLVLAVEVVAGLACLVYAAAVLWGGR